MNRVVDHTNQVDSVLSADGRRPERLPTGYLPAGAFVKQGDPSRRSSGSAGYRLTVNS